MANYDDPLSIEAQFPTMNFNAKHIHPLLGEGKLILLQSYEVEQDQDVVVLHQDGSKQTKTYLNDAPYYIIKRMNFVNGFYELITFEDADLEERKLIDFKLTRDRSTAVLTSASEGEPTVADMYDVDTCKKVQRFTYPENETLVAVWSRHVVIFTNEAKDKFIFRKTEDCSLIMELSN